MSEPRITELEIRLTHQEATLQQLNEVIIEQQGMIDQLSHGLENLKQQLQSLSTPNIASAAEETPPPHY